MRYIWASLCGIGLMLIIYLGLDDLGLVKTPAQSSAKNEESLPALPILSLTTLTGEKLTTQDLGGKLLIINFWASWCAPCIREFPLLMDTVLNKHKDDILLLAISLDQKYDDMLRFVESFPRAAANPARVKIIWDPTGEISRAKFNTVYLPETFFVKDNLIIGKKAGEVKREDLLIFED